MMDSDRDRVVWHNGIWYLEKLEERLQFNIEKDEPEINWIIVDQFSTEHRAWKYYVNSILKKIENPEERLDQKLVLESRYKSYSKGVK